jgi:hypothetical protein
MLVSYAGGSPPTKILHSSGTCSRRPPAKEHRRGARDGLGAVRGVRRCLAVAAGAASTYTAAVAGCVPRPAPPRPAPPRPAPRTVAAAAGVEAHHLRRRRAAELRQELLVLLVGGHHGAAPGGWEGGRGGGSGGGWRGSGVSCGARGDRNYAAGPPRPAGAPPFPGQPSLPPPPPPRPPHLTRATSRSYCSCTLAAISAGSLYTSSGLLSPARMSAAWFGGRRGGRRGRAAHELGDQWHGTGGSAHRCKLAIPSDPPRGPHMRPPAPPRP